MDEVEIEDESGSDEDEGEDNDDDGGDELVKNKKRKKGVSSELSGVEQLKKMVLNGYLYFVKGASQFIRHKCSDFILI